MGEGREGGLALVVCGDRSLGTGIGILDIQTGDRFMHIPTCASPPHGLLCLRDQFLVASQVSRHGSVGGGAIFTWPLNKPQPPIRSYPIEAIGPISCTKDGLYLAGGASSGNAYIWEVTNGRLLKTWHAHHKSLKCMVFSADDSLLMSGSDDGMICVWSVISLLDTEDIANSTSLLHYSSKHRSAITGLLTTSGIANSTFISSSLDGTCKVWDLISGKLIQTREYSIGITAIVLHPAEKLLFSGSIDGRIFVSMLDFGLVEDPLIVAEDQPIVLEGHNGSITALAFSATHLISASEDCTVFLWDVSSWTILRRFNHQKGAVTNLVVIPRCSLLSPSNHQRISNQFRVSSLDKCTDPANSSNGMITLFPLHSSHKDSQTLDFSTTTSSLEQQIFEMERAETPAALQMRVETSVDNRMWATTMTRNVMEMNKHLQSRLLDMMQVRLLLATEKDSLTTRKNKKLKIESPPLQEEELSNSPG